MTRAHLIQNAHNEVEKAKYHIDQANKILTNLAEAKLVQLLNPSKNNFQAHVTSMNDIASKLGVDLKQCHEQLDQMVDTQKTRQNKEARDAVRWARVVYGLDTMTEIMDKQNDLKLRCRKARADRVAEAEALNMR